MPPTVTRHPYLTIGSMPSATPAWEAENPLDLLRPPDRRHQPIVVPRAHGQLARRMFNDALEADIIVSIWGGVDEEGTVGATTALENFQTLTAAWYTLPTPPDTTVDLTLHLDSTTSYTGEVQVVDADWDRRNPGLIRAVFAIFVPSGALTLDVAP